MTSVSIQAPLLQLGYTSAGLLAGRQRLKIFWKHSKVRPGLAFWCVITDLATTMPRGMLITEGKNNPKQELLE